MTVTSILEAADRILRSDGYDAASTNRVARVAGFSVGSLYQYFRDKQAIVGALIDRELADEATLIGSLLEQADAATPRQLSAKVMGEMLARRQARAHLYQTLDGHALELGAESILAHLTSAQAPLLSETVQRVCAQRLPRSTRSVDARAFVLSRLALSSSFAFAVDAPSTMGVPLLRDVFAESVDGYLHGAPPRPSAATLALTWAKPSAFAATAGEQRARRRRESRGVLLAAGVPAERLESSVFLLASLADVAVATQKPPHGATQEDLLHEVARFAEALGA